MRECPQESPEWPTKQATKRERKNINKKSIFHLRFRPTILFPAVCYLTLIRLKFNWNFTHHVSVCASSALVQRTTRLLLPGDISIFQFIKTKKGKKCWKPVEEASRSSLELEMDSADSCQFKVNMTWYLQQRSEWVGKRKLYNEQNWSIRWGMETY